MDATSSHFHGGHRNATRLLNVFTRQLRAFERGRTPDMLLLRDIVDCLNRYTAIERDAFEATLIADLTRADNHFAPARLVLTTEHGAINELGRRCLEHIESIIDGALLPRPELVVPARRYLQMYRNHLRRERLYLRRHDRDFAGGHGWLHQPHLPRDPLDEYPNLRHHITQATAPRSTDESGQPLCPACAADAERPPPHPHLPTE